MQTTIFVLCSFFIILFTNHGNSHIHNSHFIFNGFSNARNNLTLDGSSLITGNGLLQLTNETSSLNIGHALYSSPFNMLIKNSNNSSPNPCSFSTSFVFAIVPGDLKRGGGHGLAFTISPLNKFPGASASHYLGVFNSSNDGNPENHIFAVEFDTVNGMAAFGDYSSNHVGIDINGIVSKSYAEALYYIGKNGNITSRVDLESGYPIRVWIEYDGVNKIVNVTLAPVDIPRPVRPLLSAKWDLSVVFKDQMFVGFSSSTAKLASSHYILGWSFRLNGVAQELTVSSLPTPSSLVMHSSSTVKIVKIVVAVVSVVLLFTIALALLCVCCLRRRKLAETLEDWELDCPHRFSYKELYLATNGFKQSEVIGVGGFGEVYKGVLRTTREQVAVKKIAQNSVLGVRQFVAEIESLGRLRHKHLVHLLGWCKRKKSLLLVYNFVPNGSLDTALLVRKSRAVLSWEQRFKILKDIASALLYLHEDWDQVVIHRDVKASNVLLDEDMNGRLGDFGLARLYAHGDNPRTTQVVGTLGYLAPELARIGKATTSSDVFAYGTLLLVVACGRGPLNGPNIEHSLLMDWVSDCYQSGQILEAMDRNLNSFYDVEEGELVLKLGLLCTLYNPELRPSMRQVSRYLNGDDLLSCNNLASGEHYPCVPDVKAKLAANISKNSECGPSSSSFGPISCESFGFGR
ncbi:hypothetical protein Sjap_006419 [Stephania japonica]|uniref:non-specific serine/threonine protein kinase n=1 Tax=Stephania japonica TaxID=461633 RepID=A0AAP0PMS5_9MAGN